MLVEGSSVDEWVIALAAVLIALGVIWRYTRGIYKGVKRIEAVLGVDKQGRTITERVEDVEAVLVPEHGPTLLERVEHVETLTGTFGPELQVITNLLSRVVGSSHPHDHPPAADA